MNITDVVPGKSYRIKGNSKYFKRKYGTPNPEIVVECALDFHKHFTPPAFLFLGRAMSEDVPVGGDTVYGHVNNLGEFVHVSELEELKPGG